jgi:tetratricopeptide (TPR) repeat protein
MHHKFIDQESGDIITLIMTDASNYRDFVIRLGNWVYHTEVPTQLVHIASVHAWELRETAVIDDISSRYGGDPIVKPWTYPIRSRSDRLSCSHKIHDAVDFALTSHPEDWILTELLLVKAYALLHTPAGSDALRAATDVIKKNPDLDCFAPFAHHIEARIYHEEGNNHLGIPICKAGLELALAYDNKCQAIWLLRWLGMMTMHNDLREASEYLDQAYSLAKELCSPFHLENTLTEMGWISSILGEYDLALAFYDEGQQMSLSQDEPTDRHSLILSRICCDIGDGKQAFDWAQWTLDWHMSHGSAGDSYAHLAMARALITLDRLEEARTYLDTGGELAFKGGQEREVSIYYLVSGLYEIAIGEPATAIETLKSALEICERTQTAIYINRCVLALANAEIAVYRLEGGDDTAESAGPWMSYLEERAVEKNLPGLRMQHAMLQADFRILQKRREEAREILIAALDIYNSPGVRSLQKQVLEKIRQIDTRTYSQA